MRRILQLAGPALARPPLVEALRASLGSLLALVVLALVLSPFIDLQTGLFLVPPLGASAVLLFAVPNSPLAQPWSAIVGNSLASLVAICVCLLIADPVARICLSVGLALLAILLARAMHPPSGAVAMTVALSPEIASELGLWFVLCPIALGTSVLVICAIVYNRLTGRHYPLRQFGETNRNQTKDAAPSARIGLTEAELESLLERYRQTFNLGVEDLARLIGAAKLQAASRHQGPVTAGDIMSRDLVTVGPDTPTSEIAALFIRHRFTSLPVVGGSATYLGVIFQLHLIAQMQSDSESRSAPLSILRRRSTGLTARDVMESATPQAQLATPIAALLPMMADGDVDAVPVLQDGRIIGIVTRTDLISALARESLSPDQI